MSPCRCARKSTLFRAPYSRWLARETCAGNAWRRCQTSGHNSLIGGARSALTDEFDHVADIGSSASLTAGSEDCQGGYALIASGFLEPIKSGLNPATAIANTKACSVSQRHVFLRGSRASCCYIFVCSYSARDPVEGAKFACWHYLGGGRTAVFAVGRSIRGGASSKFRRIDVSVFTHIAPADGQSFGAIGRLSENIVRRPERDQREDDAGLPKLSWLAARPVPGRSAGNHSDGDTAHRSGATRTA